MSDPYQQLAELADRLCASIDEHLRRERLIAHATVRHLELVDVDAREQEDRLTHACRDTKPRQLPAVAFLRGIGGLAARFDREVPAEHYQHTDDGVRIDCPCQRTVTAPSERFAGCECGRTYLHDGTRLWCQPQPRQ